MLERPAEFNAVVSDFLDSERSRRG
jgi:hypothetical protein